MALQLGAASYRATWLWPVRARGATRYVDLYIYAAVLLALSAVGIVLVLNDLRGLRAVAVAVACASIVTSGLMFSLERWERLGGAERWFGLVLGAGGNVLAFVTTLVHGQFAWSFLVPLGLTFMWALLALYRNRSRHWPDSRIEVSLPTPEKWSEVRFRAAYCLMIFFLGVCVAGSPALSFARAATRHEVAALVLFEKRLWNASIRERDPQNDKTVTAIAESALKKAKNVPQPEDLDKLRKKLTSEKSNYYQNNWITPCADGYTDEPLPSGSSLETWEGGASSWIPSSAFHLAAEEEAAELWQISRCMYTSASGRSDVQAPALPFPILIEIFFALAIALGFFSMLWTMVRLVCLLDADKPPLRFGSKDSFSSRWYQLNKPSRLALVQLIQENFLNPNAQGIRDLFQNGFLVRDPGVSVHKELEALIATEVSPEDLEAWEQPELKRGRVNLRSAALLFIFVVAGFLFITQPNLLTSAAAAIAGLTALVPPILKAFSLLGESKDTGK
jgi:hypothetical protein